jgi:hypothetical protein
VYHLQKSVETVSLDAIDLDSPTSATAMAVARTHVTCANATIFRPAASFPHNRGNARLLTLQVDRPLLAHTIAIYRPGRVKARCNVIFSISAFHLYHQATLSDA